MATQVSDHERSKRGRVQFGMKAFLSAATVCAISLGLFCPRFGEPLQGCANQGLESVWIAPPDRAEIITKCQQSQPNAKIPNNPAIITEKVFEEVDRCCFFNFQGRRYRHRVRYRCELFLTNEFPPQSIMVLLDYDHYHLNGGGCQFDDAK